MDALTEFFVFFFADLFATTPFIYLLWASGQLETLTQMGRVLGRWPPWALLKKKVS